LLCAKHLFVAAMVAGSGGLPASPAEGTDDPITPTKALATALAGFSGREVKTP
jgi:hypothetical protein